MLDILVINGPNINMLGTRDPKIYGTADLTTLEKLCHDTASQHNLSIECYQSNSEGEIVAKVQQTKCRSIIINAAAYTHTSVAIRDALELHKPQCSIFEVHISNIYARETFRHKSYLSDIVDGVICGFGINGYKYAINETAYRLK